VGYITKRNCVFNNTDKIIATNLIRIQVILYRTHTSLALLYSGGVLELGLVTIAGVGIEIGIEDCAIVLVKCPGTGNADGTGILALAIAAGITVGIWGTDTRTSTGTGAAFEDVILLGIANVGGIFWGCEIIQDWAGIVVIGCILVFVVFDWFVELVMITLACVEFVWLTVELLTVVVA